MYKNAKRTIEDCLVTELYLEVIRQAEVKSDDKKAYNGAKKLLQEDLNKVVGLDTKIKKRLDKAAKNVFDYFVDNQFDTRKCFLTLSQVAGALNDNEMAELPDGTIKVIADTNDRVQEAYNDPNILQEDKLTQEELFKIYRSAEKHATKLIRKLQKDGYY